MKPLMGHQEEEEEEKDATPSSSNTKDGKNNNDKANAMRSKHSVTEQRRRSKINERFQILRELIPHTDQKRDTASFLVEVIEYVQYLQAKVQKYEGGSYQPWGSEPTKLMPWRNSHWRMQSLPAHPHALKNGAGPEPTYLGRFDENPATLTCTMQPNAQNQNQFESHHPISDVQPFKAVDELPNKAIVTSVMPQGNAFSDAQPVSDECPDTVDTLNHRDDLAVDGGTVSISSPYSQELLNSLTQALQTAGLDLSQASISLQINFGKRANRGSTSGQSMAKDPGNPPSSGNRDHYPEASNDEELDQAQKRLKI